MGLAYIRCRGPVRACVAVALVALVVRVVEVDQMVVVLACVGLFQLLWACVGLQGGQNRWNGW